MDDKEIRSQMHALILDIGKLVGLPVGLYRWAQGDSMVQFINPRTSPYYTMLPDKVGNNLTTYSIRPINDTEILITDFKLVEFPSCQVFCISMEVFVGLHYRRLGVNKLGNKLRQLMATRAGYSALICTDALGNEPERKTLKAHNFQDIYITHNSHTGRDIALSIKELR